MVRAIFGRYTDRVQPFGIDEAWLDLTAPDMTLAQGERIANHLRHTVREETGLTVEIDPGFRQVVTYYPKPGVIKDVVFFIAQPTGGTERPQEAEIRQLGWFPFQEAKPLVTFATDVEVLKEAEAYILAKG